jgi:type IV secretory pathway component VirB8
VEPFEVGTRGWDLIAEKLVGDYVRKRETIDLQTEVDRWQAVNWMSSDEVWQAFYKTMGRENPQSPFERAKKEKLTRSIGIKS